MDNSSSTMAILVVLLVFTAGTQQCVQGGRSRTGKCQTTADCDPVHCRPLTVKCENHLCICYPKPSPPSAGWQPLRRAVAPIHI
ncbi:hypothetical protein ACLB2K_038212 [Fragaria x ananassa]